MTALLILAVAQTVLVAELLRADIVARRHPATCGTRPAEPLRLYRTGDVFP